MTSVQIAVKLRDYLHQHHQEMVELLEQLVLAESPSSVPAAQIPVFQLLTAALQTRGYRTRHLAGSQTGGSLLAIPKDYRKFQPLQLMIGHGDTVWPLGTLAKMPLLKRNGKLYGPGTYDMKAGLVFMIFAVEALLAHGIKPKVAPVIFISSDEEIGSYESRSHIQRLAKIANRAFVMEPSLGPEGKLKTRRKGIGEFTVRIIGKASHAGLEPEKGASAILELSFVVQKLFALNQPERGITLNVGTIDGGIRPNVVAPESKAVIDVRILHPEDAQRIEAAIRSLKPTNPNTQIIVTGGFERPPMEKTPANEKLWQLAQQTGAELGINLEEATAGGGSDGNITNLFTPTLDGLGAVGDAAHAPGEFVYLEQMIERTALLAGLLSHTQFN